MEQLQQQLRQLEQSLFYLEMDDFAYTYHRDEIDKLEKEIKELKEQIARA